jgi:Mg-chelatase subunit ChlD
MKELICILDKSGSMSERGKDVEARSGFNTFLEEQVAYNPDTPLTLVLFDTRFNTVYESAPVSEVAPLDEKNYKPSGATALLDVVGSTLKKMSKDKEREALVMILTDGEENSSVKYQKKDIQKLAKKLKKKRGWKFLFLGVDIDGFMEGSRLGLAGIAKMDSAHGAGAVTRSYRQMAASSIDYLSGNDKKKPDRS